MTTYDDGLDRVIGLINEALMNPLGEVRPLTEAQAILRRLAARSSVCVDEGLREALKDCERLAKKALTEPLTDFAESNVGEIVTVACRALAAATPDERKD